jgi:hypothetical protein
MLMQNLYLIIGLKLDQKYLESFENYDAGEGWKSVGPIV